MVRRPNPSVVVIGVAVIALSACGTIVREARYRTTGITSPGPTDAARAATAWQYFRTQRSARGIVATAAGSGFTTPGTIGDDLAAAISALRLSVIERQEYRVHIDADLAFLSTMPLTAIGLPGRFYDNRSGELTDFPQSRDPGWSATGTGRLLVWLRILRSAEPSRAAAIDAIVGRWQLCRAVDVNGLVLSGLPDQRGGYVVASTASDGEADYTEQGFAAWGVRVSVPPDTDFAVKVSGVSIPISGSQQDGPVLTTPYALLGIEFGWLAPDGSSLTHDKAVFLALLEAQRKRAETTHMMVARDSYRQVSFPFEVVSSVVSRGVPWSTNAIDGAPSPELAITSVKASYALWALDRSKFTAQLLADADRSKDVATGWQEGHLEGSDRTVTTLTSATNSLVLEALLFRRTKPFIHALHNPLIDRCAPPH